MVYYHNMSYSGEQFNKVIRESLDLVISVTLQD